MKAENRQLKNKATSNPGPLDGRASINHPVSMNEPSVDESESVDGRRNPIRESTSTLVTSEAAAPANEPSVDACALVDEKQSKIQTTIIIKINFTTIDIMLSEPAR